MSKTGFRHLKDLLIIFIAGGRRCLAHCIDEWVEKSSTHSDLSSTDQERLLDNIVHLNPQYPYGADLLGAPKEHQGQITSNDVLVIFDDH